MSSTRKSPRRVATKRTSVELFERRFRGNKRRGGFSRPRRAFGTRCELKGFISVYARNGAYCALTSRARALSHGALLDENVHTPFPCTRFHTGAAQAAAAAAAATEKKVGRGFPGFPFLESARNRARAENPDSCEITRRRRVCIYVYTLIEQCSLDRRSCGRVRVISISRPMMSRVPLNSAYIASISALMKIPSRTQFRQIVLSTKLFHITVIPP